MSDKNYRYLFPYEKIKSGSRILIYGAGTLGQDYYTQMSITHYCDVIGFVDKNSAEYKDTLVPVYAPDQIPTLQFDYVVVALRMAAAFNEIKRILLECHVPEVKVVAIFEREYDAVDLIRESADMNTELAYEQCDYSIALLTTGGFGDMVIQKRLIVELIHMVPECKIDIYNIKAIDFLKHLYTDTSNINEIIPDLGSQYKNHNSRFALALTIEACHFIHVDQFKQDIWSRKYSDFADRIKLLIDRTVEENVGITTPAHVTMYRRWFVGCNAYTGFNYNGVFEISDKKVNIPLDESFKKQFDTMSLGRYITVNCGNGDCADCSMVAKSWPSEYYDTLIKVIKPLLQETKIIQLGGANAHRISGCSHYILGENFRLVEHILKHSLLHIDIEGGLVHIATQLGTKCVVLFGPTVKEYYGYEENINISVGNCHNCWGLYTDVNKCAKGLKEPECMYKITPDIVLGRIKEYFAEMGN